MEAGSATAEPALMGTDSEALTQALRNLWPILSRDGRQTAIDVAKGISG
jgi:hypothetical protein